MRFEIGPGGMFVILLGLLALSGAVFGLGLIAGHELAGPEPGAQPVAAAFPLPAAPGSAPAPAPAPAPKPAPAAVANVPAAAAPAAPASDTSSAGAAAAPASPPSHPSVASGPLPVAPPSPAVASAPSHKKRTAKTAVAAKEQPSAATDTSDEDLAPGAAVAPPSKPAAAASESADTGAEEEADDNTEPAPEKPALRTRKKVAALSNPPATNPEQPYSIQIDAVMDRQGAQQMAHKLRAKGYQSSMVPTQVNGQTWYRLRVGHYGTPEEAQAAEAKLHQEFHDTPAGH
jgi:hypothetical protein